jgi:uncharacterized protein (UPF0332 family)
VNGLDFLKTARRLAGGTEECDWRSAISRAYYAVFHEGFTLCLTHGLNLGHGAQAHNNLYLGLNNCGIPAVHGLAGRIDYLRTNRVAADYDLGRNFDQLNALAAVSEAGQVVTDLQGILSTTPAAHIVAGAKRHLQLIGRVP